MSPSNMTVTPNLVIADVSATTEQYQFTVKPPPMDVISAVSVVSVAFVVAVDASGTTLIVSAHTPLNAQSKALTSIRYQNHN